MIVADHAYARRSCTNKPNELRVYAETRLGIPSHPTRPSKAATRWRPRTRVKVHSWLLVSHGLDNSWPLCVIALPTIVVVILGRRMCRVSELAVRRAALPCLQVFSTSIYKISTNSDEFIVDIMNGFRRHDDVWECLFVLLVICCTRLQGTGQGDMKLLPSTSLFSSV